MDVVLLHSGVTDPREWDEIRPLLEREHRVVAPLLWQAKPPRETVLEAIPGDRAALVGTSMGGRAALEAAAAAPGRVARIVLINTNPFGWSDDVKALGAREEELYEAGDLDGAAHVMVDAWLVGPQREPADVPDELRDRVFEMQRGAYELEYGEPGELDVAAVRAPLLYIRGDLDWPDVERASQRFKRVEVIEGTAHLPTLERPDEVARLLLDFLAAEE